MAGPVLGGLGPQEQGQALLRYQGHLVLVAGWLLVVVVVMLIEPWMVMLGLMVGPRVVLVGLLGQELVLEVLQGLVALREQGLPLGGHFLELCLPPLVLGLQVLLLGLGLLGQVVEVVLWGTGCQAGHLHATGEHSKHLTSCVCMCVC